MVQEPRWVGTKVVVAVGKEAEDAAELMNFAAVAFSFFV